MEKLIHYSVQLAPEELLLVQLAVAFLVSGVVFILIIFAARVWKSGKKTTGRIYQAKFRNILNDLVVSDSIPQAHNPQSAINYKLEELMRLLKTRASRQILLDQMIDMKRNLSGNSVKTLKMLYTRLEVYSVSLQKLNSLSSYAKARGIRELAVMGHTPAYKHVSRYLRSRNRTLREEAILATLELSAGGPLAFLADYRYDITLWMRIQLHRHLQKPDPRTLPDFSRWFKHHNVTVVLFTISMAKAFRQTKSMSGLISLLQHADERVVSLAIESIAALEAFEFADTVGNIAQGHFDNRKISRRIARCLGAIGTIEKHGPVLLRFIRHDDFNVRFTALKSLTALGMTPDLILDECGHRREETALALRHLSEPLLN